MISLLNEKLIDPKLTRTEVQQTQNIAWPEIWTNSNLSWPVLEPNSLFSRSILEVEGRMSRLWSEACLKDEGLGGMQDVSKEINKGDKGLEGWCEWAKSEVTII